MRAEPVQRLLQGGNRLSREPGAEPGAGVQLPELLQGEPVDLVGVLAGKTSSASVVRSSVVSCMRTSSPSLLRCTSTSTVVASCWAAASTAASVFSGA